MPIASLAGANLAMESVNMSMIKLCRNENSFRQKFLHFVDLFPTVTSYEGNKDSLFKNYLVKLIQSKLIGHANLLFEDMNSTLRQQ